jgi:hypothetical protein
MVLAYSSWCVSDLSSREILTGVNNGQGCTLKRQQPWINVGRHIGNHSCPPLRIQLLTSSLPLTWRQMYPRISFQSLPVQADYYIGIPRVSLGGLEARERQRFQTSISDFETAPTIGPSFGHKMINSRRGRNGLHRTSQPSPPPNNASILGPDPNHSL